MGGTNYSKADYTSRATHRAATGASAFVHDAAIKSGKISAGVDPGMDPYKVKYREARDSDTHPVTIPIGVVFDSTGSMQQVPEMLQKDLNRLMGTFLDDKSSGKKYLGEAYPAIAIGANDDYFAQLYGHAGKGALQIGQFESGIEIDDNLGKLWLTGNGGGNEGESYDLALYFFARHTVHDHFEKRKRKGYLFLIGDEPYFDHVDSRAVKAVIGDDLQDNIPIKQILQEAQRLYHVYFIMPNLTSHWADSYVHRVWKDLLGERFVKLSDPREICPFIASLVALNEGNVDVDDLTGDGISSTVTNALIPLANSTALAATSADNLPAITNKSKGVTRL